MDRHESSHNQRKYERVVSYVVGGQHFNTSTLMLNGENHFFNPIKESFVNLSQTDSRISSLQREFKPKVMNKIKLGEQTPYAQNNYSLEEQHQNRLSKGETRYYKLKTLILPDENKFIPDIGSPQLPPKKPSHINLTSSKSLNLTKQHETTKQVKKPPKVKLISTVIKRENAKYDRESSRKLVENWLESIRPFYESKQISHETTPPIDLNKSYFNQWRLMQEPPHLHQMHPQYQLPKLNQYPYKVARPIFEPFGIYHTPYFHNFGYINYFPFLFRKF